MFVKSGVRFPGRAMLSEFFNAIFSVTCHRVYCQRLPTGHGTWNKNMGINITGEIWVYYKVQLCLSKSSNKHARNWRHHRVMFPPSLSKGGKLKMQVIINVQRLRNEISVHVASFLNPFCRFSIRWYNATTVCPKFVVCCDAMFESYESNINKIKI